MRTRRLNRRLRVAARRRPRGARRRLRRGHRGARPRLRDARDAATVADAQRLGAQALTDERLDRALLLARTGVDLDDSVATRGNLLSTLLRARPGSLGVLPDVRDIEIYSVAVSARGDRLAIGDAFGEIQVFDPRTRRRLGGYRRQSGTCAAARLLVRRRRRWPSRTSTRPAVGRCSSCSTPSAPPADPRSSFPLCPRPRDFVGVSPLFTADGRDLVS